MLVHCHLYVCCEVVSSGTLDPASCWNICMVSPREQISPHMSALLLCIGPAPPSRSYTEIISWIKLSLVPCSAIILSCLCSSEWHHLNHVQSQVYGGIVQTPRAVLQKGPKDCLWPPGSCLHYEIEPGQHGQGEQTLLYPHVVAFLVPFVDDRRLESNEMTYAMVPYKKKKKRKEKALIDISCYWVSELGRTLEVMCINPSIVYFIPPPKESAGLHTHIYEHLYPTLKTLILLHS